MSITSGHSNQGPGKGPIIALSVLLLTALALGVVYVFPTVSNQGYAPDQPIPFSHKLHAGANKIDCKYCHAAVETSRHATIPSMNVCMNCHSVVKLDSPHIQNLRKHFQEGKPVEWVRVHELPDYVYFPHNRHVAKGLACESCHGEVKSMDKISQFAKLNMGWCLKCHEGVTTPKAVLARVRIEQKNPHGPIGPLHCTACHN
ncbi:cytochrome c family protein [bacterium]|jgi:hypothetical protein|nr:cytochrome c family protein [bacterium]